MARYVRLPVRRDSRSRHRPFSFLLSSHRAYGDKKKSIRNRNYCLLHITAFSYAACPIDDVAHGRFSLAFSDLDLLSTAVDHSEDDPTASRTRG